MNKIKFITDSASDISTRNEQTLGIQILPFPISFGDTTYFSRVDIDNETFYQMLETADALPTTSQITVYQYQQAFEAAYREGCTDVINVTINSEASGTYNSACLAKQLFYETHPEAIHAFRIRNIDSAGYTGMYGYAVVEGAKRAQQGQSADEIEAFVRDWTEHAAAYFVPYTLKYASKSGRIPGAAAFVGELMGLKPVMRISDRKIDTNDKIRGEKKIIPTIAQKAAADMQSGTPYAIIYGSVLADAEALAAAMTEAVGYPPVDCYQVGAAIATNAGHHIVGVAFRAK